MVNTELTRFYDQLLQFPLFQGLSRTELLQMAGNTKFGFMKLPPNKVVMREGDTCQQLFFLIKGQLTMTTTSDDHSYSFRDDYRIGGTADRQFIHFFCDYCFHFRWR